MVQSCPVQLKSKGKQVTTLIILLVISLLGTGTTIFLSTFGIPEEQEPPPEIPPESRVFTNSTFNFIFPAGLNLTVWDNETNPGTLEMVHSTNDTIYEKIEITLSGGIYALDGDIEAESRYFFHIDPISTRNWSRSETIQSKFNYTINAFEFYIYDDLDNNVYIVAFDYDFSLFFVDYFETPELFGYFPLGGNYTIELQRVDVYANDYNDDLIWDTTMNLNFLINGTQSLDLYGREQNLDWTVYF